MIKTLIGERETIYHLYATNKSIYEIWTNDITEKKKFDKIGAKLIKEDEWGWYYNLPATQFVLKKPVSDKAKAKRINNLKPRL